MSLYHYTSLTALVNILKEGKLRLSSTEKMNDAYEGNELLRLFKNEIISRKNKELLAHLPAIHDLINRPKYTYICSFSKNPDLLSQWVKYADNGFGVAIKFNEDCLPQREILTYKKVRPSDILELIKNKHIKEALEIYGSRNLYLTDVNYDLDIINELIESTLSESVHNLIVYLGNYSLKYSPSVKNKCFSEEDESRIIYLNINTKIDKRISEMKQRISNNDLISYFDYKFNSDIKTQNCIEEIILGPKCKVTDDEFYNMLKINNCEGIKLRRSMVPYV